MPKPVTIQNLTRPDVRPARAGYCASFFCRLRGLMFRARLDPQDGLLLVQPRDSRTDASIHMFFVPFDLYVVWINSSLVVVDTVLARAWRPAYFPKGPARYTLEIHPDRQGDFAPGDKVSIQNA